MSNDITTMSQFELETAIRRQKELLKPLEDRLDELRLEGEMDEIVDVVNGMQQPKQKKLTYTEYVRLVIDTDTYAELYNALIPYLADEQPDAIELTSSDTKPDPSRLEVAMSAINTASQYVKDMTAKDVLNCLGIPRGTKYVTEEHYPKCVSRVAILIADKLIKQANG